MSLSILTPQKCLFREPGPLLYRFQPLHWRVQGSLGVTFFSDKRIISKRSPATREKCTSNFSMKNLLLSFWFRPKKTNVHLCSQTTFSKGHWRNSHLSPRVSGANLLQRFRRWLKSTKSIPNS